jgi:hypothetical protein
LINAFSNGTVQLLKSTDLVHVYFLCYAASTSNAITSGKIPFNQNSKHLFKKNFFHLKHFFQFPNVVNTSPQCQNFTKIYSKAIVEEPKLINYDIYCYPFITTPNTISNTPANIDLKVCKWLYNGTDSTESYEYARNDCKSLGNYAFISFSAATIASKSFSSSEEKAYLDSVACSK